MILDVKKFYQATLPGRTLFVKNEEEDKKYYIDFSSVRGGQIIENLKENITLWSAGQPTCQLFTGHIGCGKSTELLRLKADLEGEGFHVVYFESDADLDVGDVDVGDILLAIARRVSESFSTLPLNGEESQEPKGLLSEVTKLLHLIEVSGEITIPGIPGGKVTASTKGEISLNAGIAKITAKAKASPDLRSKLRGYLEPRTDGILDGINQELLEPGIANLKKQNYQGLVVIVDNLDRIYPYSGTATAIRGSRMEKNAPSTGKKPGTACNRAWRASDRPGRRPSPTAGSALWGKHYNTWKTGNASRIWLKKP